MRKAHVILAVVLASLVAGTSFLGTSQPALAASLTASNVVINSKDGTITEVTVAPSGTVSWNNFDSAPKRVRVSVYISKGPDSKNHLTKCATKKVHISPENRGESGSQGFSFDAIDLTDSSPLSWTDADFASGEDGGSKPVSGIKVKLKVKVLDSGKTAETNASSFDVTTNNLESSVSVSGRANTGGSA